MSEKRSAEACALSSGPTNNGRTQEVKRIKSKIQKRLRQIENSWWEARTTEIQDAANRGDSHELYSLLRKVYGPCSSSVSPIRSADGSILHKDPKGILNRWREHFDELLNRESLVDQSFLDKIPQRDIKWIMNTPPTFVEVSEAICALKLGKAPGRDGIAPEMLRFGGEDIKRAVWEIILEFWENDSVHQDWRDAIMVILYKSKGKRDICGNYRGIALLCVVGKILSRIMLSRLTVHISNNVLPESQCGFRAGRSTSDMIFSARQIQEKCREQRVGLYQVFIDLTKAFDTVNRTALWQILGKLGCPDKFVRIIKSFHDDMKVWVSVSGDLSDPITVENGVKQGDIPAPTLFALYFYIVFALAFEEEDAPTVYIRYRTSNKLFTYKRFEYKSTLTIAAIRDLLYADDCDLVCHTEADMQKMMDLFSKACSALGLTISLDKTKVMFTPPPGEAYIEPNIFVYGKRLGVVLEFIYLGSKLHQSCSLDSEITYRISRASAAFSQLSERCWSRRGIRPETKVEVYKTTVLRSLLSSLETCTLYSKHISKLERFQQSCLRDILNIRWQSLTTNEAVLQKAGCTSITALLLKARLRWTGHVVRMPDHRIPKQLLYGELCIGTRAHGGQMLRYKDTVRQNLKKCNFDANWEVLALERAKWRKSVHDSVTLFEEERRNRAGLKRAARKRQPHPLATSSNTITCNTCGRILLTRSGYLKHMAAHERQTPKQQCVRECSVMARDVLLPCQCQDCINARLLLNSSNPAQGTLVDVHDVMTCQCQNCVNKRLPPKPPNQCADCLKICKSKGGLTLHRKIHNK